MKAFFMKLLKDKAMKKASESLSENGISLSPLFKYAIFGGGGFVFFLLGIIVICVVVFAPVFLAEEYFGSDDNKAYAYDYCGESCGENESKFYSKLNEVRESYKSKGITIDTNLISGTVFYGSTLSRDSFDPDDPDSDSLIDDSKIHVSDVKSLASNMVSGSSLDYSKYRSYLVNTYIPKRFKHLYTSDKGKEKIADEIMSYANYKGTTLASTNSIGVSCSTITLKDDNGNILPHDIEEYVAGVVSGENDYGVEAAKMQAIAARTNAVSHCNSVIDNKSNFQKYKTPSASGIAAADATKGLILTYNGSVLKEMAFASYPMAFYNDPDGFPGYYEKGALCGDVVCGEKSDGRRWCQTTIYRLPDLESFILDMPDKTLSGSYWNEFSLSNQAGHCYGVSQVATRYYEDELNYDYKKMIEIFFSDGVQISTMGAYNGEIGNTDGTEFLPYELDRFLGEKGSSVESFNASIRQAVVAAGPGTRAGVVAAANALVNGLSQYGVKLPYISSIDNDSSLGHFEEYGVDSTWGTVGRWRSGVYNGRIYTQKGLDCSGFVSWAIHNGGYTYITAYSGSQHNVGIPHAYQSYNGKPGDILWVSGHVGLIIGVEDGNYIVAEEHGGDNGLEVTKYSMNSSSWTDIVDMDQFYADSSNLSLSYYQGG